ncbi:MAG: putative metal-dependent phosphoesterases (PHP family) [Ktedonobacterales bacterium]|nr:MAG: putative metal-dependent phosphoesterases (PHP family) [Ktedonobacterales bacterium]
MTLNTLDLHTHSTASDGIHSPTELVTLAHEAGLKTIGLVDHDTTGGLEEALAAGERLGVAVVPGIEINTDLPNKQGEAHMLGYYIEYDRPEFQQCIAVLREARALRGERMVAKLREQGLDVTWERVREIAGGAVGRPHVARALLEKGYADSISDAFDKWIGPGRPAYIPRYKLSAEDAVRLVKSARGVPVLAHPANIPELKETLLPSLVMVGLQGLECYYGEYDTVTVARLLQLANTYGLIPTGGSDYHGPNMHPTPLGARYVPDDSLERLRRTGEFNRKLPAPAFTLPAPTQE